MTIDEFSKLVAGKWIASNEFADNYQPTECIGALACGDVVYYVLRGQGLTISLCRASGYESGLIHISRDACHVECDSLNGPSDEYDEAEDEEEAA